MAAAALLALFPVLLLFSPRLAVAVLVVAIVMLYSKRVSSARSKARDREPERPQAATKDPWNTDGIGK
jgi:uncharacterized membrane protein YfcA